MAIVQNPLTGRSSGKFAGAIFQTYFGKNVIRSKPLLVYNPKSDAQVQGRSGFAFVQKFITKNLPIFRNTCQSLPVNQSVYIACMSYYLQNVLQGIYPAYYFASNSMLFSYGNLPGISIVNYDYEGGSEITLNLSSAEATNPAYEHNQIQVVVYNSTTGNVQYFKTETERKDLAVTITGLEGSPEDALLVYAFCFDSNSNQFSVTSLPVEVELSDYDPQALEITFNDIANAPAHTLSDWNEWLEISALPTKFTSYSEVGNTCKLFGGSNISFRNNMFDSNSNLLSFIDKSNSVSSIGIGIFGDVENLQSVNIPLITILPENAFINCVNLVNISIPYVSSIENDEGTPNAFYGISSNNINLTIKHSIESDVSIVALKAANTVTVTYSD